MNWFLMALSAILGGVATWFWSVRKVHRKVPVYEAGAKPTPATFVGAAAAPAPVAVEEPAVTQEAEATDTPPVEAPAAATLISPTPVPATEDSPVLPGIDVPAATDNPHGWTIKGNGDSGLYHTVKSPYYKRTKAEAWFETEADAEAAGFVRWDRRAKKSAEPVAVVSVPEGPYGPGSAAAGADGSGPAGWTIKGNADSMLFHTLASPYYKRTKAEAGFETEDAAEAAGFTRWDRREKKAAEPVAVVVPDGPYGPGSAAPAPDGSGPDGWTVKGNADSGLYHALASPYYSRTKAEVWFQTEEAAAAAGFARWDSRRKKKA